MPGCMAAGAVTEYCAGHRSSGILIIVEHSTLTVLSAFSYTID